MQRREFESLVQDAMKELPQEFLGKLKNVAIVIEDYPSQELLDRLEVDDGQTLFGLYEGVPLTERSAFAAPLHPDRILIFQGPIEDECDSLDDVREQVRITLLHEIAHFFGFDDDDLAERGYD